MAATYVYVDALCGTIDPGYSLDLAGTILTLQSQALAGFTNNPGPPTIAAPQKMRISMITRDPNTGAITNREDLEVTAFTQGATSATITRGLNGTPLQFWPAGSSWIHGPEAEDMSLVAVSYSAFQTGVR